MNRFLSAILVLVFLVSFVPVAAVSAPDVWDGSISVGFAGGTGTETDPYLISNGNQLAYLAKAVNLGTNYSGKYIKLTNDIVLNDTSNWESWSDTVAPANSWTPIGNNSNEFSGNFDGTGYTVSGICINTGSDYQGLFGYIYKGMVKNASVINSYIKGDSNIGGVAAYSHWSTITNCYNTGTVIGSGDNVGGVAGYNDNDYMGIFEYCYNAGAVTGSGKNVGGVVGFGQMATNCFNIGTVKGQGSYIGGVAGYISRGEITNCYNTGSVGGSSYVGGVIGGNRDYGSGFAIINCYNIGTVTGLGDSIGGVAGFVSAPYNNYRGGTIYNAVTNCYNTGTVSGSTSVGGVVGGAIMYTFAMDKSILTVTNCYNTGAITGSGDNIGGVMGYVEGYNINYEAAVNNSCNAGSVTGLGDNVGGVVGYNKGMLVNCYNTYTVTGVNNVGGVAGYIDNNGTLKNSYNVGTVSGTSSVGGVAGTVWGTLTGCYYLSGKAAGGIGGTDIPGQAQALSDTQMKQPGSFTGWDFASVWYFGNTGESYKYPMLIALRKDSFTFDPDSDLQINDDVGALTGVNAGITTENLLSQFSGGNIGIYKNGEPLGESDLVGTGCEIRLMDGGEILDSLTVVVKGDLDGDGKVNVPDARKALRAAVKLDTISDFQALAADVDGNGKVEVPDARLILRVAVGLQGF